MQKCCVFITHALKLWYGHHISAVQAITQELFWVKTVIIFFLFMCFSARLVPAECLPGKYGSGCALDCSCQHNSTCDRFTGCCHCPAGFYGHSCQHREWRHPGCGFSDTEGTWGFRTSCKHLTRAVKMFRVLQVTQLLPDLTPYL